MQYRHLAIVSLLSLAYLAAGASAPRKHVTIFQRIFSSLHQGPPQPSRQTRVQIETAWIEQKLDHFNESDTRTWKMRYMSNDEHFKAGGPIFIFVGGEWQIYEDSIAGGHIYDMAREHNGYLYYTEHRFYGESKPLPDLSTESLKYLHVRQALADLAHFITTQKASVPGLKEAKVVLVGGSYSATMVTWFKKLYPELAAGCWASSAPLHAKVDFVEYKEVTGQSINLVGGEACYNRIQKGIAELEELFFTNRGADVHALLQLCSSFEDSSDLDRWTLFSTISDIFAGVVQTHDEGNIEGVCNFIMKGDSDLIGLANFILNAFKNPDDKCVDISYNAEITALSYSTYNGNMMRQWIYQTCNEYGWYQTSGSKDQPFGTQFPVTFYTSLCYDVFGKNFTNEFIHHQIEQTNLFFGGLQPNVENVYMSHGQLDPWRAMGIQDADRATVIPNYAHCKDLSSISDKDSTDMRASKDRVAELVRQWVGSNSQ